MRKCDICGEEEVTYTSGYHYGPACCRKNVDRVAIHNAICNAFPSLTLTRVKDLCGEMFGDFDYGYSRFPNLYKILDRGGWNEKRGMFNIPSHIYLVRAFEQFIKVQHPKLSERVKNDKRIPEYW
ncbi:MAG: hypothetical protein IMZ43_09645 [Thermoplasmata archaeon]|nr:hypothetical protein [Thermoplasmata archaeon]